MASLPDVMYPSTPRTPVIQEPIKLGSALHVVNATQLTIEAALLEPLENVAGQGLEGSVLDVYMQRVCGSDFLFFWSNTKVDDDAWSTLFDQRPALDELQKNHTNSVFNAGLKLAFETITGAKGDLFVLVQSELEDDMIEHRIARYGQRLDQALQTGESSSDMSKFLAPWDVTKARVRDQKPSFTVDFCAGSVLEEDSVKQCGSNLNELFTAAREKGRQHGAKSWFCAVMGGPLAEVQRSQAGAHQLEGLQHLSEEYAPIVALTADGITYIDSNGSTRLLADLYSASYLPRTARLAREVGAQTDLCVYVEGEQVDFSRTAYTKIAPRARMPASTLSDESHVLLVNMCGYGEDDCRTGVASKAPRRPLGSLRTSTRASEVDYGVVATLSYRIFDWPQTPDDSDLPYGVLIASKDSHRFLSRDPKAFYKDHLGMTQFTEVNAKTKLFDGLLRSNSLSKKQKKIQYRDLIQYMDKEPAFTKADWDEFWDECMTTLFGKYDGMARLYRAIGMGCLAIVSLGVPMDTDYSKSKLIPSVQRNTDDAPAKPSPVSLIGAIYRTLVSELFWTELKDIRRLREEAREASLRKRQLTQLDDDSDDEDNMPLTKRAMLMTGTGEGGSVANAARTTGRQATTTQRLGFNDTKAATETARRPTSGRARASAKRTIKASHRKMVELVRMHRNSPVIPRSAIEKIVNCRELEEAYRNL